MSGDDTDRAHRWFDPSARHDAEGCGVRAVDRHLVDLARSRLLPSSEASAAAALFAALGDPLRSRIVCLLCRENEMCPCNIAATLDVSISATEHALSKLRLAGAVVARKQGDLLMFRVPDQRLVTMVEVALAWART